MNQKILNKVFVWGFLFLYLLVACISFCHAIQFFNIGNVQWMSITLAFAFELGLALSLAAILLSDKNKSNTLPWILMIVLCAVQVIGNVYSTFKYISLSGEAYYQYLAKPLLFFIEEVDENTIQVIVSWIIGAILPIIALMMTDMVATNLKHTTEDDEEKPEESTEESSKSITTPEVVTDDDFEPGTITIPNSSQSPVSQDIPIPEKEEPIKEEKVIEPLAVPEIPKETVEEPVKEEEDEDNIINYVIEDTPAPAEKSQEKEPEVQVPLQQSLAEQNNKAPLNIKVEPIVNTALKESKHVADEYYFKNPEVK